MSQLIYEATDTPDVPEITPEYSCQFCGTELTYIGRGRKPRWCTPKNGGNPECEGPGMNKSAATPGTSRASSSTKKVEAAMSVMDGVYDGLSQVLMVFAPNAAGELEKRIPKQQERNRLAFETNPALCDRVMGWGRKGGTLAFLVSNALLIAAVGRIAYGEVMAQKMMADSLASAMNNGGPDLATLFAGFAGQQNGAAG
jgi:hypothetical protein